MGWRTAEGEIGEGLCLLEVNVLAEVFPLSLSECLSDACLLAQQIIKSDALYQ